MDFEIFLLINNVRSLYNVGAILRTAEAAGVKKVYLGGYSGIVRHGSHVDLHPNLKKTALAGINIDWEHTDNAVSTIKDLKQKDIQIIALEQTHNSINYLEAEYSSPLCLVVGHERDGVDNEIIKLTDKVIEIPMQGKGKSLNVSVATGIALFEIIKSV